MKSINHESFLNNVNTLKQKKVLRYITGDLETSYDDSDKEDSNKED